MGVKTHTSSQFLDPQAFKQIEQKGYLQRQCALNKPSEVRRQYCDWGCSCSFSELPEGRHVDEAHQKETEMKHSVKNTLAVGAILGGLVCVPGSALAQLGVGVDTNVNTGVSIGVERERTARPVHRGHYTYDGYRSHEWHTRHTVNRSDRWYSEYNGYDCYESFRYDYEDGERVRYTSTFCYDDRGRSREVRSTRVIAHIG